MESFTSFVRRECDLTELRGEACGVQKTPPPPAPCTCLRGEGRPGASAEVGEDDGVDGQPAHRAQLVPLLQLPRADVAGYEVSCSPVNDAAVLRPRLTDETRVQARLGQPPLRRHAALQFGHRGRRWISGGRWEKLLGVDGGQGLGGGGRGGGRGGLGG